MFDCIRSSLYSVHFGQLLRCAHKRIVNIMKVYSERNTISGINTILQKNSDFIDIGNCEVGIYFRNQRAHWYPRQVATVLFKGVPFWDMTTLVHAISGHIQVGS